MKKVIIIAMVCSICLATSACSGQTTESTETASSTTQNVIETTISTEKPTEPPTETIEYTAIELADKSLDSAILFGVSFSIADLAGKNSAIDPNAIACYNEVVLNKMKESN